MVAPFSKSYGKTWVGCCFNTRKRFFLEISASFMTKLGLVFVLTLENAFS